MEGITKIVIAPLSHTPGSPCRQIRSKMHSETMVNIVGARWLLFQPALETLSYDTCVSKTT